jgi:hypothetical protein
MSGQNKIYVILLMLSATMIYHPFFAICTAGLDDVWIALRCWWLTLYVLHIRDRMWSHGTIFHRPFILPLASLVLMRWADGLLFLFVFDRMPLSWWMEGPLPRSTRVPLSLSSCQKGKVEFAAYHVYQIYLLGSFFIMRLQLSHDIW